MRRVEILIAGAARLEEAWLQTPHGAHPKTSSSSGTTFTNVALPSYGAGSFGVFLCSFCDRGDNGESLSSAKKDREIGRILAVLLEQ